MEYAQLLQNLKFDDKGLISAIAQDANTGRVLMLAYMNAESLKQTLETGYATYFSRSRQALWVKGETSGNKQRVCEIYYDCDGDALLLRLEQSGSACHTGEYTCFHNPVVQDPACARGVDVLCDEFAVIEKRKVQPKEGSYTNYLFEKGIDKICKKVGEEAAEVIIAAKNRDKGEVAYEAADLFYHVMVLLSEQGMSVGDVFAEMEKRKKPE